MAKTQIIPLQQLEDYQRCSMRWQLRSDGWYSESIPSSEEAGREVVLQAVKAWHSTLNAKAVWSQVERSWAEVENQPWPAEGLRKTELEFVNASVERYLAMVKLQPTAGKTLLLDAQETLFWNLFEGTIGIPVQVDMLAQEYGGEGAWAWLHSVKSSVSTAHPGLRWNVVFTALAGQVLAERLEVPFAGVVLNKVRYLSRSKLPAAERLLVSFSPAGLESAYSEIRQMLERQFSASTKVQRNLQTDCRHSCEFARWCEQWNLFGAQSWERLRLQGFQKGANRYG